ncbi:MAG: GH25 family lysozyme, partial [Kineothrix sp.]
EGQSREQAESQPQSEGQTQEQAESQPQSEGQTQEQAESQPQSEGQTQEQDGAVQEIKVSLDHTSLELQVGESFTLRAVTDPAGNHAVWTSSDSGIITVQDGIVTAAAPGKADIIITTGTGNTAVCSVTVSEAKGVRAAVVLKQQSAEMRVGNTLKLEAEVSGTEDRTLTWQSDNQSVAAVAADGTVTAVGQGTAMITAVWKGDSGITASCQVTVKESPESDRATKLKDQDGNQLYVKDAEGNYREAVYADYYTAEKFYKRTAQAERDQKEYKYTGWQTIDGRTYYFDANGNKVTGEQVIQGARYTFDSDGVLSASSGIMGIDVSKWNGSIDWNAVKNSGVSYVIIRCGYRGSSTGALIEDPRFRANIKGASAAGLKVGIYFFSQAVNEVEAVEEASMVLGLIGGYRISYPVFLDVEASGGRGDNISKAVRTEVCRAFCQTIQNAGYTAGIYANTTWLNSYIDTKSLTNYKIWLAQYAAAPTYNATRYDIWQYSAKGSVAGIRGHVDLNISYLQ